MKTSEVEARELIAGARQGAYGPPRESFERIAKVWSAILKIEVTAHQVSLCMAGLKLCREANKHGHDNVVDLIGYALLGEEECLPDGIAVEGLVPK